MNKEKEEIKEGLKLLEKVKEIKKAVRYIVKSANPKDLLKFIFCMFLLQIIKINLTAIAMIEHTTFEMLVLLNFSIILGIIVYLTANSCKDAFTYLFTFIAGAMTLFGSAEIDYLSLIALIYLFWYYLPCEIALVVMDNKKRKKRKKK